MGALYVHRTRKLGNRFVVEKRRFNGLRWDVVKDFPTRRPAAVYTTFLSRLEAKKFRDDLEANVSWLTGEDERK